MQGMQLHKKRHFVQKKPCGIILSHSGRNLMPPWADIHAIITP